MYRLIITSLFFLFSFGILGQTIQPPDTVYTLDEVWVEASREDDLTTGHPTYTIDSNTMQRLSSQHLAFLLSRHSGMFIKSYSPSSLATTSLRGGSAGHTALLWNGFNLQNPMNQQSDLSLLPVFFMDEINIQHGGGSALWGSGAIGGTLSLNNKPPTEDGLKIMAGFTGSSLEDMGQHISLECGIKSFGTSLKVFHRKAANRYRYINNSLSGSPLETQEYASFSGWGMLQENYLRIGTRHHLKLRFWWQDSSRNIPPTLQQNITGSFQNDETLRLAAEWQSNFNQIVAMWRGGFFKEKMLYRDSLNQQSISHSNTFLQEGEIRWQMAPQVIIYSGLNISLIKGSAMEYEQPRFHNSFSVFSSAAWESEQGKIKAVASVRQEMVQGMNIPLVPSLGFSWKPFSALSFSLNAGKNYRLPSLNDRYWIPGGNPDLKPESGWSQDITATWQPSSLPNHIKNSTGFFPGDITATFFNRKIKNWIIWLPGEGGNFWSPENIMEVSSRGLEARTSGKWQNQKMIISLDLNWDYIISRNARAKTINDASIGKQLIYVPLNRAGAIAALSFKNLAFTYNHQFTSRRYITSDNSQWLEPYTTGDISFSWSQKLNNHLLELTVSGYNIWNTNYQIMASRPMPLRYFEAGINIHFFKN